MRRSSRRRFALYATLGLLCLLVAPRPTRLLGALESFFTKPKPAAQVLVPATQVGTASWYGPGFKGRRMASMVRFSPEAMVAAHRYLPLGSLIRVRNLDNNRVVHLKVMDRGPYVGGRILDVSQGAARVLGFTEAGLARVEITLLGPLARPQGNFPSPTF